MGDRRLSKRVMSGELENAGKRGPGGEEKGWMDGLRGRGSSAIWDHGGLEHRRTVTWGLVQLSTWKGL